MNVQVVILAAGQGKRMQSSLPKVLQPLAGKSLLQHVLAVARNIKSALPIAVIYGHQGEKLREAFADARDIVWIEQAEQLGTGHALHTALPQLSQSSHVLVLYGDVPLITEKTLLNLITSTKENWVGMITATLNHPTGYGRVVRDAYKNVVSIIEEKDATDEQKKMTEINTGIYLVETARLKQWLPQLNNQNAQGEFYLTDIITLAVADNMTIHTIEPDALNEIEGVNDKIQLARLERTKQLELAKELMKAGVTLCDPNRIDIRGKVSVGRDVTIDVDVILEGHVIIGNGCYVGPYTILRDTTLGDEVEIKSHSVIEASHIGDNAIVGPFARVRPGTQLEKGAHIGNFVEIKNSRIGHHSKVNHLSYIGDSEVGQRVNIGAGTITCNYDGAVKHKTVIGDDVHIGSDTQLVAPLTIGDGATIGAGSTVTKNVPPEQLTLTTRLEQRTVPGWRRPTKDGHS